MARQKLNQSERMLREFGTDHYPQLEPKIYQAAEDFAAEPLGRRYRHRWKACRDSNRSRYRVISKVEVEVFDSNAPISRDAVFGAHTCSPADPCRFL